MYANTAMVKLLDAEHWCSSMYSLLDETTYSGLEGATVENTIRIT